MSATTDKPRRKRKSEPKQGMGEQLTAAEEQLDKRCTECGELVPVTIPKGTAVVTARWLKFFDVMCPECTEKSDAEERAREAARMRERNASNSGIPKLLRGLTFESYDTSRQGAKGARAAAEAWARGTHEKRGLLLCGPVGVGKTRLAATAAWAALGEWQNPNWRPRHEDEDPPVPGTLVRWVNVADLIARLTAAFGDKDRAEALRTLTGHGAIVLDDLDKINPTLTVLAHLYTAIDNRLTAGSPLFVTTNLWPEQLRSKLSTPKPREDEEERRVMADSIVSRLTGYCTVHGIKGEDGRK